ncbi:MAG TPA: hypothetical protein VHA11_00970, partial [Bryobacteraceae bacterium]|nr:hypothetical protein [Bryobacteraceae bacterium]
LEARLKQIETELPAAQGQLDFLKIQYLSSDQILSEARDLYSRWGDLEYAEKRKIVENITEKISVGRGEISIDLCYLPPASELVAEKQRNFTDSWPLRA